MRKVMSVFGIRPDAIKMAPLVKAVRETEGLESIVCVTGQHREILDQVLGLFEIVPDYDLQIMQENQSLFDITTKVMLKLKPILEETRPDCVLVHGDSTTALAAALSAFYLKIPVGHVEAGLRTHRLYSPFPEEINRQLVAGLASFHFAPTEMSERNLLAEGLPKECVYRTGNTVVDALKWVSSRGAEFPELSSLYANRKMVLMTVHRRENQGAPLTDIFSAVAAFARKFPDHHVVYPMHPNPKVREVAKAILSDIPTVSLIEPVNYEQLVFLLKQSSFLISDSGGIQEEAPAFGKPLLVLRDTTERPEAIHAGCAKLVGTDRDRILSNMTLLSDPTSEMYVKMSQAANPFGDGQSGPRIAEILKVALESPPVLRNQEGADVAAISEKSEAAA